MDILNSIYNGLHENLQTQSLRISLCTQTMANYVNDNTLRLYGFHSVEQLIPAITEGCKYHDIGRIMLPDMVFVDSEASDEMISAIERLHPYNSYQLVNHYGDSFPNDGHKRVVSDICLCHHERIDGSGYPGGLKRNAIPLLAELCGIAHDLDIRLWNKKETGKNFRFLAGYILNNMDKRYSREAVRCFLAAKREIFEIYSGKTSQIEQHK